MALISCPECQKEISDKATSCPFCGYPIGTAPTPIQPAVVSPIVNASPTKKRKHSPILIVLIVFIVLIGFFVVLGILRSFILGLNTPSPTPTNAPIATPTTDPATDIDQAVKDFMNQCIEADFGEFSRNPDSHGTASVYIIGKVFQIVKEGNDPDMDNRWRVDMLVLQDNDSSKSWIITYYPLDDAPRILANDSIIVYGFFGGIMYGETVTGEKVSSPSITAVKINRR